MAQHLIGSHQSERQQLCHGFDGLLGVEHESKYVGLELSFRPLLVEDFQ